MLRGLSSRAPNAGRKTQAELETQGKTRKTICTYWLIQETGGTRPPQGALLTFVLPPQARHEATIAGTFGGTGGRDMLKNVQMLVCGGMLSIGRPTD